MKVFSGFLFTVCIGLFMYAVMSPGDTLSSALAANPDGATPAACSECHDNYGDHSGESAHKQVECKECHGVPDPALSTEQTHEQLFKPGMEKFNSPDFCFSCHKK